MIRVKCPRCKKEADFSEANPFRPFCSERCQLIDLGQWAEGKYAIPVTDASELDEEQLAKAEKIGESSTPDKSLF